MASVAYYILSKTIVSVHGKESFLPIAIGKDFKGIVSVVAYALAVAFAFILREVSLIFILAIAVHWLVPDKRIEKRLKEKEQLISYPISDFPNCLKMALHI